MKMIARRGCNALLVSYWRRMALAQQRHRSSVFLADTRMIDDVVDDDNHHHLQNIAIVGGGLAGLSTAFHLLQKSPSLGITILDTSAPGEGGASTVAGG
jgi:ribulose 1,5-bisphosphate synthetase/thiazole synthase